MANEKQAPTGGPSKRNEPREAEGDSAIRDSRPGSTKTSNPELNFEGLGNLADFPEHVDSINEEGYGTKCVVLSDVLAGANGDTYVKGQVQCISRLVSGYGDKELEDGVKSSIRRLVSLGAIRHATPEEIKAGFAIVTTESESEATQNERSKRLELELENDNLKKQLMIATGKAGTEPAAPGTTEDDPFKED